VKGEYQIFWEERGVRCICAGVLSSEFVAVNRQITSDPRFLNAKFLIIDFREVREFAIDSAAIRKIAQMDAEYYEQHPVVKTATITRAKADIGKGLSRMYQTFLDMEDERLTDRFATFDSEDAAMKWINSSV
jgi:hypothetical protein